MNIVSLSQKKKKKKKKLFNVRNTYNKLNVRLVIQHSTIFLFPLPRLQLYAALDFLCLDLASAVPVIQVLSPEELLHL